MHVYWGDSHLNLHPEHEARFDEAFAEASEHLDFLPLAYYPFDWDTTPTGLRVESTGNRPQYLAQWEQLRDIVRTYHQPGRFVPFLGYEWHGDRTRWGDHNVFYFDESGPLDDAWDFRDLCANLRRTRALAIPHHVGYATCQRAKDWSEFDPALSPFVECFSVHGLSETPISGWPAPNAAMGPFTTGSDAQSGLAAGCHTALIASGDNHSCFGGVYGNGLMAVWADELTREALWSAMQQRRVYGVTGDRIVVDYRVNDACLGSIIEGSGPVTARLQIESPTALDRVEWLRNNRVLQTVGHRDGLATDDSAEVRCRLRVEPGWGPLPNYGFELPPKHWHGRVTISAGRLGIVQGCWRMGGNRLRPIDDRTIEFETITRHNRQHPTEAFILEADAPRDATVTIDAEPFNVRYPLSDGLARTQLWVDYDGVKQAIATKYGHAPEEVANPDVFHHNAYKLRVLQAATEREFTTDLTLTDNAPLDGESWYYVRVHAINGQMAWCGPVWVSR